MNNILFRGPVGKQPRTISAPVAGAYLPGRFMLLVAGVLTAAAAVTGRLLLLGNRDFYSQTVDVAYAANETGIAYELDPNDRVIAQVAAGTYADGDPLTVDANGRLAAPGASKAVVAFIDHDAGGTYLAGDLVPVVIANSYMTPAA